MTRFRSNTEIAINVTDLDAARRFYGEVMGFTLRHDCEKCLEFDAGALRLYVNRKESHGGAMVPSMDVTDVAEARERLVAAGCTILTEGKDGFWFRDPFGAIIDVVGRN